MVRLHFLAPFVVGTSLLGAFLFIVGYAAPVSAVPTTIYNISPGDAEAVPFDRNDGICTLAEAIEAANDQGADPDLNDCPAGSAGTNIIQLEVGTYSLTISPFSQDGPNAAPPINTPIEIRGVTSATTVIERSASATDDFRFFFVGSGSLVLQDLTLTNGYAPAGNGGGAIRVLSSGSLTMTGVTLSDNTAREGGAIYAGGNTAISASTLIGNSANQNGDGLGGAIYVANQFAMANSNVTANTSVQHGGGLYIVGTGSGQALIALSSLTQNIANSDGIGAGAGGGIYHSNGNLSITLSTLDMNIATLGAGEDGDGGGLFVAGDMEMDFTLVSANGATNGAGLYVSPPANIAIRRSLFTLNVATDDGGGVYNRGSLLMDNGILWANVATSGNGGGLHNNANSNRVADIRNSTIMNNTAPSGSGGGMYNLSPDSISSAALSNVTVAGNQAGGQGGGIANGDPGYMVVANGTIYNNSGGGIAGLDANPGRFLIRNSIVASNDCSGTYTSQGYNLDSGATCTFAAVDDISNGDPDLGPLSPADPVGVLTGNITPGYQPQTNSDALNTGNPLGCFDALNLGNNADPLLQDQWGMARPYGGPGYYCDRGAIENQAVLAVALLGMGTNTAVMPWGWLAGLLGLVTVGWLVRLVWQPARTR